MRAVDVLTLPGRAVRVGLAVDVAAFAIGSGRLKILLVRRGVAPHFDAWALPGGFVRAEETLEQAALRELRSETAMDLGSSHLEQLRAFDDPGRDPRGRVISVAHLAVLAGGLPAVHGGDAVTQAIWHDAHALPPLAFDHLRIAEHALHRLRIRLEYAQLAFEFLPPSFTLPELQAVYEAVLNRPLDKRNFRKRLLGQSFLEPLAERRSGPGRPARLYRPAGQPPDL